ncbi:SIR2 family NAD-dependent protein deacylase [Variovorax ginsengisoli]|uniref:NAD-dependent protein deacylase n=1 Tax=Variovorax ginsengisoli TaxID=363844 RepID=A0ABT8SC07_9BURK|nr:NAD-dependent deacylase [Variovorax ginsengisoli]MDN8617284.1 NAD-dependent deacylase [Variovorax ginsengisoli]MDO1536454.1 NAD-dependent deacylase [Variovorax ginsengisoli]
MTSPPVPPAPLVARLRGARRVVVLSGAGMSAESGIPTFRDKGTGLWARFDPQELATPEAFRRDPETVWAWYEWRRHRVARAFPHAGHMALTALAARPQVESLTIVTQNVDDLHERAGAEAVLHLHGSLFAPRCFDCGRTCTLADPQKDEPEGRTTRLAPPRCATCNGPIRPGVVWFGESLPEAVWLEALRKVEAADLLLVVGTSGLVHPAASLPDAARRHGCDVAVLNPDASTLSDRSGMDWQIQAAVGLPALLSTLEM